MPRVQDASPGQRPPRPPPTWVFALILGCLLVLGLVFNATPSLRHVRLDGGCGLLSGSEFSVYSRRVVTPQGVIAAAVYVDDGKIVEVKASDSAPTDLKHPLIDYGSLVISPGLVDVHVHVNQPGRTRWEGFRNATRAAAAGGVTTIVDMPLNSYPPTTTVAHFQKKLHYTRYRLSVDAAFWGGLVPDNAHNASVLESLLEAGVCGFKAFLVPSGVDDFPMCSLDDVAAALPTLARYGVPLLVHAELGYPLPPEPGADPRHYQTYLDTRPPSMEEAAITALVSLLQRPEAKGAHIHVVHLSDAAALGIIADAKRQGLQLTVETCPHYLTFSSEDIPDGATQYKCSPPIRDRANRARLWAGLKGGQIDLLSSDHSPSLPSLKHLEDGNFLQAWGGISSLQFVLPATWTAGQQYGVTLEEMARWWSTGPAALAGLKTKGSIQEGYDADMVVWDPGVRWTLNDPHQIYHTWKVTPYFNTTFKGLVKSTFVRGKLVFRDRSLSRAPCGQEILPAAPNE